MAQIVIEFDWTRDPKGYRLVDTGRSKMLRVVRNGKGHSPKDYDHIRPLDKNDSLFSFFAQTANTPDGVLDFVTRFGPLTPDGWSANGGDYVNLVISNADRMRQILRSAVAAQSRTDKPPTPIHLGTLISLDAMVVWDPATNAPKWELRPKTLLDALWLQLGQKLTGGAQWRECNCGKWFEVGRGTGRRADAIFCSEEHKIAFHSLKRSKEK
jgi:hypothetical protein